MTTSYRDDLILASFLLLNACTPQSSLPSVSQRLLRNPTTVGRIEEAEGFARIRIGISDFKCASQECVHVQFFVCSGLSPPACLYASLGPALDVSMLQLSASVRLCLGREPR